MSQYNKTAWKSGDIISSEKLNNMQNGIEQGCLFKHEITNPQDNQILKYNSQTNTWFNSTSSGDDNTLIVNFTSSEKKQLNKTWQEICDAIPNVFIYYTQPEKKYKQVFTITQIDEDDANGYVIWIWDKQSLTLKSYVASSPNDYPIYQNTR